MTPTPELLAIVAAAVLPSLAWAVVLFTLLPAGARSRLGAATALGWGAGVAATIVAPVNDAAGALAGPAAMHLVPVLVGPVVEELAKASALAAVALVAPRLLLGRRGPVVAGALAGLGFAAAENVGYDAVAAVQAGWAGLGRALYLRGVVEAANHAVMTGLVGAGVARARARETTSGRGAAVALGLVAAIVVHAAWNALVSGAVTTVLCNASVPGGACAPAPDARDLLVAVPALELAFLVPTLILGRLVLGRRR